MGYKEEADAYMNFITERFVKSRNPDGSLPIMFTIRGDTDIPEKELLHLDGYRGSRPVRVGNGAADHHQFDIYGELMASRRLPAYEAGEQTLMFSRTASIFTARGPPSAGTSGALSGRCLVRRTSCDSWIPLIHRRLRLDPR